MKDVFRRGLSVLFAIIAGINLVIVLVDIRQVFGGLVAVVFGVLAWSVYPRAPRG